MARDCPLHGRTCRHYVPKSGPNNAKVMLLGEGPGRNEIIEGEPFIGKAGDVLNRALSNAGIARGDILLYNVVSCFGSVEPRTPTTEDLRAWKEHVHKFILSNRPEIIILAGAKAMQAILGKTGITQQQNIERRVGLAADYTPLVIPIYHPAATLYNKDLEPVFFKSVEKIGTIIRETQNANWAKYQLVDDAFVLNDARISLEQATAIALDIESSGTPYDGGKIVCVGLQGNNSPTVYVIALDHPEVTDAKYIESAKEMVKSLLHAGKELIAHNGKFDFNFFHQLLGVTVDATFDTMLAAHLLDESRADREALSLKKVGLELFGIAPYWLEKVEITEEVLVKGKLVSKTKYVAVGDLVKLGADKVPLKPLARYNAYDTALCMRIYEKFSEELAGDGGLNRLFQKLVIPAANVIGELERNGIAVDTNYLDEIDAFLTDRLNAVTDRLSKSYPDVNWDSPKQVADLLFNKLGLPVIERTEKTGHPSTDKLVLVQLKGQHPIIDDMLEVRDISKQKNTYVDGTREAISNDRRIHTTILITGAKTGRVSSISPNLQNYTRTAVRCSKCRTKLEGNKCPSCGLWHPPIRNLFVASPNHVLVEFDLSLIELRMGAVVYREPTLLRLLNEGKDLHRYTASLAFGKREVEINSDERQLGKTSNFLLIFGGGPDRLSDTLKTDGMTNEEAIRALQTMGVEETGSDPIYDLAVKLHEAFHRAYPDLRAAHDKIRRNVRALGYVRSIFSRIRRFPDVRSQNVGMVYKALMKAINAPVQGPANDINLLIMRDLAPEGRDRFGARLLDIVHDSQLYEVPEENLYAFAAFGLNKMRNPALDDFGIALDVPIEAEVKVGKAWGTMSPLEVRMEWASNSGTYNVSTVNIVDEAPPDNLIELKTGGETKLNLVPKDMLAWARTYLDRGWSVIPLNAPGMGYEGSSVGKQPAVDWETYQTRRASLAELQQWFGNGTKWNVGIVTGSISKLVVVDVDHKRGGDAWVSEKALDSTLKARTGGGGLHLYFHYDGPPLRNRINLAPGVDIRAEGGQVAATPSNHTSGNKYAWENFGEAPPLPEWLISLLSVKNEGPPAPLSGEGRAIPDEKIDGVVQLMVPYYTRGARHDLMRALQGFLAKRDYRYEDVEKITKKLMSQAGDEEAWDRMQLLRDTYEAIRGGTKQVAGALALEAYIGKDGVGQLLDVFGTVKSASVIEVLPLREFVLKEFPKQRFLIDTLLPRGGMFMLSGHPGVGKTTVAFQMAMQLATGEPVFNSFTVPEPVRVLYLQADNPPGMIQRLITSMLRRAPKAADNVWIANFTIPIAVDTTEGFAVLEQTFKLYEPDVILLDTIRDFHLADENNPTAVQEVVSALKRLRGARDISIGWLHHHSKTPAHDRAIIERHMGSMRFQTPTDLSMALTFLPEDDRLVQLTFAKVRWGLKPSPIVFRRQQDWYEKAY